MTHTEKNVGVWVGFVVLGAVLGTWLLSSALHVVVAAAVGSVAGSLVALTIGRGLTAGTPAAQSPSPASTPAPPAPSDGQVLNQINLRIRSRAIAPELVTRIETLIDRLTTLLPTLGGEYAGFELTWQIQRIANTYLPKLVDAYSTLTDAQRGERRNEFEQSLRELEDAVARTAKAVDEKNTAEFGNVSAFLKLRFS